MAVRDALLSILLNGPAYGFQLHGELATRTGGRRSINVGQTYATLERLTERGLIEPAGATDDGLPLHRLTEAGRVEALAWLQGADAPVSDPWDETVDRVLLASTLPGVDLGPIVADEVRRWRERRDAARAGEASAHLDQPPGLRLAALAAALDAARADAVVGWLAEIATHAPPPFELSAERPRRGRRPAASPHSASA